MNRLQQMLILSIFLLISCNHRSNSNEETFINQIDSLIFDCYEGNQIEMNICSLKELEYYDSILSIDFNTLIALIDSNLTINSQYADSSEYHEIKTLKNAIIKSQETWIILRDQNAEIQSLKYKGGTMEIMMKNLQMTKDTKIRIRQIKELINSEIQ